jgi:glycosyltransferase involved in cell wall biosynthesis
MLDIIFIIPTIGRDTLSNTINSLKQLTCNNWKCIIVFDCVENHIEPIDDNRFIIINKLEKHGDGVNGAGVVRNIGFDYILNNNIECNFVGFVDDDDMISPYYIENLHKELEINNDAEVVVFRMMFGDQPSHSVLPDCTSINAGHVGISFCVKRNLIKENRFENGYLEDFKYLKNIQDKKHKIVISAFVNYFIRSNYNDCVEYIETYSRIIV